MGQYAGVLEEAGRVVFGVDFSLATLAELRGRNSSLLLVGADVAALPFRSSSFDVYSSLGVVEHFEAGPEPALAEAWRILIPGGLLLISVPDFNRVRRLLVWGGNHRRLRRGVDGEWVKVREHAETAAPPGLTFFQYAYTPTEFRALLNVRGFTVESEHGYSILWGVQDVRLMRWLLC